MLLRADEGYYSISTAENQLRLILEEHLNNLIAQPEEYSFLGSLPLLEVAWRSLASLLRRHLRVEVELQWLELLVSIEVALEMLKQDDFLVNSLRVVEEIQTLDVVLLAALAPLNVVEVEQVRIQ